MAIQAKQPYSTVGPTNTVFNWEDTIASIGYKSFYGLNNTEGLLLVTNQVPSYNWATAITTATTIEQNYDHEFLAAADIEGVGFIEFTEYILGDDAGAQETMDADVRLIHVNSAAGETEIVGTVSKDLTEAGGPSIVRVCMNLTIPYTHFAVGDKLRLELIITTTETAAGTFILYHDPANRGSPGNDQTGTAADTTLKITIPFKIPL